MFPSVVEWLRDTSALNGAIILNLFYASTGMLSTLRGIWDQMYGYIAQFLMATVYIDGSDPLHDDLTLWINDNILRHRNFQAARAVTKKHSGSYRDVPRLNSWGEPIQETPPETKTERKIDLKPVKDSHFFRYEGKWILISQGGRLDPDGWTTSRKGDLKLQCLSLSLSFLRQFLTEVAAYRRDLTADYVTIYQAKSGVDYADWNPAATRPARDISTVILEKRKKNMVLDDIEDYLEDKTRKWYANHGIPYRRGYLFSGPPGTGKTSLASAIAGLFSLDIYILSLTEGNLTEQSFLDLCASVPSRCIVLLEDIDVAGISLDRDRPKKPAKSKNQKLAPAPSITLSTLLNAIDGAASQEGRILIMTTNAPDSLDSALIRPGRVDMHVRFELPSQDEYRSLFLSIFKDIDEHEESAEDEKKAEANERLNELAAQFAQSLPEKQFTLAEVQGFLLRHKKGPKEACAEAAAWVTEMANEKKEA